LCAYGPTYRSIDRSFHVHTYVRGSVYVDSYPRYQIVYRSIVREPRCESRLIGEKERATSLAISSRRVREASRIRRRSPFDAPRQKEDVTFVSIDRQISRGSRRRALSSMLRTWCTSVTRTYHGASPEYSWSDVVPRTTAPKDENFHARRIGARSRRISMRGRRGSGLQSLPLNDRQLFSLIPSPALCISRLSNLI